MARERRKRQNVAVYRSFCKRNNEREMYGMRGNERGLERVREEDARVRSLITNAAAPVKVISAGMRCSQQSQSTVKNGS